MRADVPPLAAASLLLVSLRLAAPGPAVAQEEPDFEEVRGHIRQTMASRGIPSVAVAAARDGEVVWEEAFGWADRESRRPATVHTPYSLASITKPMTATAVLDLAEAGRVDLDAPVNRYLDRSRVAGRAGDAAEVTVRRVLSHTAGLPLHYHFFYRTEEAAPPPMAETIRRYAAAVFPPGERFAYSNLGYGVLDHVVSRVAGRGYAAVMRTRVFVPLGLHRTSIGLPGRLEPYAATRYDPDTQEPIPRYDFDHVGASAAWSSAHDLVRFGLSHLGHAPEGGREILAGETRRRMRRAATPEGAATRYGLGWFVERELGYRKVWHSGSMPGVSTMLALYPAEDAVVVVLINTLARDLRGRFQRRIAAALIPGYAEAWRREAREDTAPAAPADTAPAGEAHPGPRPAGFDPPSRLVGTWTGTLHTWREELPVRISVRKDGDVHARLGDQLETVVNDPEVEDGVFTGRLWGHVPTPDVMRHPLHVLRLEALVGGGAMRGQLTAITTEEPIHYALSSYLELERQE